MLNASKFFVDDSVIVKQGAKDPHTDGDMSGWQGRISSTEGADEDGLIEIRWDSVTLKKLPLSMIKSCEQEGLDWTVMNLGMTEVDRTAARDTERDVKNALKEISKHTAWFFLDEEGERIQKILDGIDPDNDTALIKAWKHHLKKVLACPFEAKVSEQQERGALRVGDRIKVKSISGADDLYGIIVDVDHKGKGFGFPLCDLELTGHASADYQIVRDYAVWFANR